MKTLERMGCLYLIFAIIFYFMAFAFEDSVVSVVPSLLFFGFVIAFIYRICSCFLDWISGAGGRTNTNSNEESSESSDGQIHRRDTKRVPTVGSMPFDTSVISDIERFGQEIMILHGRFDRALKGGWLESPSTKAILNEILRLLEQQKAKIEILEEDLKDEGEQ